MRIVEVNIECPTRAFESSGSHSCPQNLSGFTANHQGFSLRSLPWIKSSDDGPTFQQTYYLLHFWDKRSHGESIHGHSDGFSIIREL